MRLLLTILFLFPLLVFSQPTPTIVWHLDETTGTTVYDAIGSIDGTMSAGVSINQTGKFNKAYLFDNSADNVTYGDV